MTARSETRARDWLRRYLWLVLPALWLVAMVLFYPFRFVFEFDVDEGVHLIEGLLRARGYDLYGDVFSDHPPGLPYFVSWLVGSWGGSVTLARLAVLLSSGLLMVSAAGYLKLVWGTTHALTGMLLLALVPYYHQLSVSVMSGLPAIAMAVAAFAAVAQWRRSKRAAWLVASAVALGLSVMTKLFTVWLALPLIVYLGVHAVIDLEQDTKWSAALRPALVWVSAFVLVVAGLVLFFVGLNDVQQLMVLHLQARDVPAFVQRAESRNIDTYLSGSWGFVALGFLGAILAARRRRWTAVVLGAWAGLSYLFLSYTIPVWYHHQLLITVPAALLAAVFAGESVRVLWAQVDPVRWNRRKALMAAGGVAVSVVLVAGRLPALLSQFRLDLPNVRPGGALESRDFEVLALMSDHADETELVITDRPMFAFRLGVEVPPDLALFSEKRVLSDPSFEQVVVSTLNRRSPEQVLLARFSLPQVEAQLSDGYELVYTYQKYRLYIRQDLLEGSAAQQITPIAPPGSATAAADGGSSPW